MKCSVKLDPQLLALKWINDNIESFGGDPNNITLAGQSAGAVSAHFMMLSDLTKGLFHKAILQSGSCLGWWAYKQDPDGITLRLAKELGWGESDLKNTGALKQFLTEVPQDKGDHSSHFTSSVSGRIINHGILDN